MICREIYKIGTLLRVVDTIVTLVAMRITNVASSLRLQSWCMTGRTVRNLTRRLGNETAAKSLDKLPVYCMVWKVVCCVHTQQRLDRALTI